MPAKKSKSAKRSAKKPAKKAAKAPAKKVAKVKARKPAPAPKRKAPAKKAAVTAPPPAPPPPPPSPWIWHELLASDLGAARSFYGALFGWTAEESTATGNPYTVFSAGDCMVAGLMAIPQVEGKPVCPPHWLAYLRVEDVDATVAKAAALGATVDAPPMDVPTVGRIAVLRDPTGAGFAVYRCA